MQTLYLDIYFLINFSVDIIALYFSVIFSGIPASVQRLLIGGFVGAVFACASVFISAWIYVLLGAVMCVLSIVFIITGTVSAYRKIKFAVSFFAFQFLLGGFVNYFYGVLDKYLLPVFLSSNLEIGNRRLILLALVILLCISVLKLVSLFFASRCSQKSVCVQISFRGRCASLDALCDSGNLAKDPMDSSPVVIVKKRAVLHLFPELRDELFENPSLLTEIDWSLKRKIRLLPIEKAGKSSVMLGIKADLVSVSYGKTGKYEPISVTVAIDNEEGSFGGYDGLMPTAAICDVCR